MFGMGLATRKHPPPPRCELDRPDSSETQFGDSSDSRNHSTREVSICIISSFTLSSRRPSRRISLWVWYMLVLRDCQVSGPMQHQIYSSPLDVAV